MAKKVKTRKALESSDLTFEQAMGELVDIVRRLEDGQLSLDDTLAQFESGMRHYQLCNELLERAEKRIELLLRVDAEGNPVTEPFDDQATESVGQRRGTRGASKPKGRGETRRSRESDDTSDIDESRRLF